MRKREEEEYKKDSISKGPEVGRSKVHWGVWKRVGITVRVLRWSQKVTSGPYP
jgi:hypothetical protein